MKKIFLLIILTSTLKLSSQNSFITKIVDSTSYLWNTCMTQLPGGNYLIFAQKHFESGENYTKMYKVNAKGKVIDSLNFHDSIGVIMNVKLIDTNRIMYLSQIFGGDSLNFVLGTVDTNMNIIELEKFKTNDSITTFTGLRYKDGIKLVVFDGSSRWFRIKTETIDTIIYESFIIHDMQILDSNYLFSVKGTDLLKFSLKELKFVDTLDMYDLFPNHLTGEDASIGIKNNKIYVKANFRESVEESSSDNIFMKFDTNMNFIDCTRVQTPIDEHYTVGYGFSSRLPDALYSVNTSKYYIDGFQIEKVDTNLNIVFQKFIEFTSDEYTDIYDIFATDDGGAIVSTISDHKITLYKFANNGYLLDLEDHPGIKLSDYKVYPNPASDYLKIFKAVQIPEAEFILYNTAGQIVLRKTLVDNLTEINVRDLPPSTYFYNIITNGKLADKGKIILKK